MPKNQKEGLTETGTETPSVLTIDKFIFRGGELVTYQIGDKFYSTSDLINMQDKLDENFKVVGKNDVSFRYVDKWTEKDKDGNDVPKEQEHKIIITDQGTGRYLSISEKGEPLEKTFRKLIS